MAKSVLKHGFKAKAERLSLQYRQELGLQNHSPLCGFVLAEHLRIKVFKASTFLTSVEDISRLKGEIGVDCGWSALTMQNKYGETIIVYNPFHSEARQQSDIMHELSHFICGHSLEAHNFGFELPIGMRSYNELYEEEAKCLGSTLQLTKEGLLWGLKNNFDVEQLAQHFNASSKMVNYRLRLSGAAKQFSYY
jgi:Zn-dependent peptidase ImmA (M78 family)